MAMRGIDFVIMTSKTAFCQQAVIQWAMSVEAPQFDRDPVSRGDSRREGLILLLSSVLEALQALRSAMEAAKQNNAYTDESSITLLALSEGYDTLPAWNAQLYDTWYLIAQDRENVLVRCLGRAASDESAAAGTGLADGFAGDVVLAFPKAGLVEKENRLSDGTLVATETDVALLLRVIAASRRVDLSLEELQRFIDRIAEQDGELKQTRQKQRQDKPKTDTTVRGKKKTK